MSKVARVLLVLLALGWPAGAAADSDDEHPPGATGGQVVDGRPDDRDADASSLPELTPPDHAPPEFRIGLGPMSAMRSMTFEGDTDRIRHRPNPYVGAALAVTGRLATFDDLDAYLLVDADVGYGVTRNRELTPDRPRGSDAPTTELTYGGARLAVHRQINSTVLLGLAAGIQATGIIVEPNAVYTGHRYLAAELAVQARWFPVGEVLTLGLELGAYPVFNVDNSDGAYGPATGFGMRAQGQVTWRPFTGADSEAARGLGFTARYRLQRYRTQFPDSPIGSRGGISEDMLHTAALMVDYAL